MQTSFNVNGQKLDRREVNPEMIARMAESAKNIKTDNNASADSWQALSDRVTRNDSVSKEDLAQIQALGKACFTYHKKLHNDLKASGYKDQALRAELQDVHVFQSGNDAIKDALMIDSAKTAVQALAGASFGPTGIVTAYAAYAKLNDDSLQNLMGTLQDIRDGKSHTTFAGNAIEAVHVEQVWQKMNHMLDAAVETGRAGEPVEVNAQYYELTNQQVVGKLAAAAEAGNKVRVNVDAGRLVAFKGSHVVIDEVPDKLRAIIQMMNAKGDIAVSAYPVPEQLGSPGNLMHRKGLRVGDQFLLSGMNANEGSGENVDAGYVIEGPAATQLVKNFARDVGVSIGASNEAVYGQKPLAEFMDGDINMGTRGLIGMFDCAAGPSPAGTSMPRASDYAGLARVADSCGVKVSDYTDCSPEKIDELLAAGEEIPLSKSGKEKFLALVDRALGSLRTPENIERLKDITPPAPEIKGVSPVGIADLPVEREALMLTAIQDAEKFIYIPAFVMTRTVASMLVAKRDEMREQGKEIDIRVICDPGVYPDGGTPNEAGVKFLENEGVNVRWANLPRTGWHDRKIHAKELLTDKGEFFGSTNFSNKGLRENWEHSGYVKFDESDASSVAQRDSAVGHFLQLWDKESFELNSLEKGKKIKERQSNAKDFLVQADEARFGVLRDTIKGIETLEEATGRFVESEAQCTHTQGRIQEFEKQGYDKDTAVLLAVQEKLGKDEFYAALEALPERAALEALK